MDDGKGEFQEWATRRMAEISASTDYEYRHYDMDDFLLKCLGSCQWSDEAERIRKWFDSLDKWYA